MVRLSFLYAMFLCPDTLWAALTVFAEAPYIAYLDPGLMGRILTYLGSTALEVLLWMTIAATCASLTRFVLYRVQKMVSA